MKIKLVKDTLYEKKGVIKDVTILTASILISRGLAEKVKVAKGK